MIDVKTKINSFFIFNSSFGPKEGDELKRILFFHPNQISPDARKIQVGLCEAVVKFMSTFSSEPCEALQTQTQRYIFYQPEKGYWMVMVVRIPYATKALNAIGETKGDVVEPSVVYDLLESAYRLFRMFIGPFKNISPEDIYNKCDYFFTPYLQSKNLTNDVTDVIQGINYLPLDKNTFFKVITFIDLLEVNFPDFKCVSFVYNEQLIWNGLATNDMLTLYQYLVQTLLPRQVEKEIQGGAVAAAQKHGRFISPPEGISVPEDLEKIAKVYLMREDDVDTEPRQYYLIIYRTLSATVCFTVDANKNLEFEALKSLEAFISPQLYSIASAISEQCALHALHTAQLATTENKFVYFNRLNLAFKSSSPVNKLIPSTTIKPEVLSILAGIHADRKSLGDYGEIIIKTPDEFWITGKTSNEREFYVVIQEKNANLKDISDEVKRICEAQMKGIFFYPM